jgi:hypothetical protein
MGLKFETDSPLLRKLRCGAAASRRRAVVAVACGVTKPPPPQNRYGAFDGGRKPRKSKPHRPRKDGGRSTLPVSKYAA